MRRNINETVDKMKYLFEYHFKSGSQSGNAESGAKEEHPVKFKEIGDKYSNLENDFPTFEEYRNEVVIDEDEPVEPEKEQPVQPNAPAAPAPAQPAPAQPEPQMPAPAQPEPQMPAPAPAQPEVPMQPDGVPPMNATTDLENKLNDQIAKTDQMLAMIQQMASGNLGGENEKVDQLAKEVESIKNPDVNQQYDMISKKSYPYNIKLSDYWGWNDQKNLEDEKEQEYTITPSEVNNYDPNLIKQSLNINENKKP